MIWIHVKDQLNKIVIIIWSILLVGLIWLLKVFYDWSLLKFNLKLIVVFVVNFKSETIRIFNKYSFYFKANVISHSLIHSYNRFFYFTTSSTLTQDYWIYSDHWQLHKT